MFVSYDFVITFFIAGVMTILGYKSGIHQQRVALY